MSAKRSAGDWPTVLLPAILFGVTAVYLGAPPYHLGESDEALFLYESQRILAGDVFYVDLYDIITPGSQYLMASVFAVFGANLFVARVAMALLHGLIALLVYSGCRSLGVRRELGFVAGLAQAAVCHPAWPFASPHWVSTLLVLSILLLSVRRPPGSSRTAAFWLGMLVGSLILVQQQKGIVLATGVLTLIGISSLLDRWYSADDWHPPLVPVVGLAGGVAMLVVPAFAALTMRAGVGPIFRALVSDPLTNYPKVNQVSWGEVGLLSGELASYSFPALLEYLPVVLVPLGVLGLRAALRRRDRNQVQALATLVVIGGFSVLSVLYRPDFIHLAFIAPLFLIGAVVLLESLARLVPGPVSRPASLAFSLVLSLVMIVHVQSNQRRRRDAFGVSFVTAFGRIDFRDRQPIDLAEQVLALLSEAPNRDIFCYPGYPALFLITGTRNPIPHQLLRADYNDPDQIKAVLETLETKRVPLAVLIPKFIGTDDDPLVRYVHEHYDAVPIEGKPSQLYRRRDGDVSSAWNVDLQGPIS